MMTVFDPELTAQQAERAKLREDYLRTLAAMANQPVKVKMYENINIVAKYKASDPEGYKMFVASANLPMGGVLPSAILRCSDIISAHFTLHE